MRISTNTMYTSEERTIVCKPLDVGKAFEQLGVWPTSLRQHVTIVIILPPFGGRARGGASAGGTVRTVDRGSEVQCAA